MVIVGQPGHDVICLGIRPTTRNIALDPNSLVPDCYWDKEPGRGNTVHSSPVRRMREIVCRVRVKLV